MKIAGIIAEYDPFHNGHAHQIQALKTMGCEKVVVAMGTACAQRGGFYLVDEQARAKAALAAGADLIISLPPPASGTGAEAFGAAGVALLSAAGCDTLAFGAETPDTGRLMETAALLDRPALQEKLKEELAAGVTYAAARQKAAEALQPGCGALLSSPNNILGVEYCKAILRQKSPLQPLALARLGAGHGQSGAQGGFASGSFLRRQAAEQTTAAWQGLVPGEALELYRREEAAGRFVDRRAESLAILSRLRGKSLEELAGTRGLSEGLEHRLAACVKKAGSLDELCELLATRRYPAPRLRRLCTDAALGWGPELGGLPPYIHVLGAKKSALHLLKNAALPAGTSLADLEKQSPQAALWAGAAAAALDLRALCRGTPGAMGEAYTRKPVFSEEN